MIIFVLHKLDTITCWPIHIQRHIEDHEETLMLVFR
jgi:hypothetical protein